MIRRKKYVWLWFLLPSSIVLVGITIFPLIYLIYMSLHKMLLYRPRENFFIGFENYHALFLSPRFWNSVRLTLSFTGSTVSIQFFLGLAIAFLLSQKFKGRRFVFPLLIIPLGTTPIIASFTWRILYHTDLGLIAYLFSTLGISSPKWLADPRYALFSLIIVDTWQWFPFTTLIFLGGISSLPREVFEAAKVDGCSIWSTFIHITLPLLRPIIAIVILVRTMDSFKTFDVIYGLTKGGPGIATETMNIYLFLTTFYFSNFGQGSALAFIMLVMVIGICVVLLKCLNIKVGEGTTYQ